ncbi:MAG: DUF3352 domain-containing protein [Cyanophyceae cyanobacterium]
MNFRAFLIALATVVLILLGAAAGSFYWIISQSPLNLLQGGVMAEPTAAMFVPRQAPVMVSLLVNPDRLEALGELAATPRARRQAHGEFTQIKESLLANTGLDYRRDIQPWLGDEITLAVTSLDFDRNQLNGIQPGYLLAATAQNPDLAREFLQLSYSKQALAGTSDLVFEQYKGVNIIYKRPLTTGPNSNLEASAVVGDVVLFANAPKVLRDAINNVQAKDLSLKNAPAYQEALTTIREPRIGIVYANLPALSSWVVNAPAPENPEAEQLLAIALQLQPQGLAAQTALIGIAGDEEPALSNPVAALQYVPANSVLTAAGTDLNQLWNQVDELDPQSPLRQLIAGAIASIEAPLGLDLPQDIFSWVRGEYALALLSPPETNRLDWVFVAETSAADAEPAIESLDRLAKAQGLSVGILPVADTQITAWTQLTTSGSDRLRLDAEVAGVHTSVAGYEVFATSVDTLAEAVAQTAPLATSKTFQQAIAPLPTPNSGTFYLNWSQGQPIFEQQPLVGAVELAGKPLFEHLRSLGLSSLGSENGVRRAAVFFNLD